ncbi:MAG: DUF4145 domain-containing protein [Flavobacteriales bacterium]|nr:DUF4145 domain-containing protein [Flavobacteriales bacterium]MCL4857090.1 DUF4145 domain-containing protein [Flavobacteriales bacterium]
MEKIKAFCNRCNTITNHSIKYSHQKEDIAEIDNNGTKEKHFIGSFSYQIIECKGCESITYKSIDFFNQFMEIDKNGMPKILNTKIFETYYPERLENSIVEKRIIGLPLMLRKAYQEVIQCYNFDLRILASAGLRAIIEGICNHYSIKGTLRERIDELGSIGLISNELAKSLHSHRFLGNYALHRLDIPEQKELKQAIELIEFTLETLFGIPEKHKELSSLITKRTAK